MTIALIPCGAHAARRVTPEFVELDPPFQGEYVLRLKDGTRLVSGRTYRKRIQQAFSLKD